MRAFFVILLIPALLLQSCAGLFIMTAFYANRSYIAQKLCENRNNERASLCGGQCVLMKKLKKQQEKEDQSPELKFKDMQLLGQFEPILYFTFPTEKALSIKYPVYHELGYHNPVLHSIFHPPLNT